MTRYRVSYEVRNDGAIGVFEWRDWEVSADDPETAGRKIFDKCHSENLETRGGPRVTKPDQ